MTLGQTSRVVLARTGTLRPEGGVWHVEFNGKSAHVPDLKGLWHLRELVFRPREPVPALSLIAAPSEDPLPIGDAGPALDREALRQYRKRLAELDEELIEAEARHDVARHAKRTAERDALLGELARATGLGGRPRRTGSPSEKARLITPARLRENFAANDLELTQADLERVAALDRGYRLIAGAFWVVEGGPWTLQTIWDGP